MKAYSEIYLSLAFLGILAGMGLTMSWRVAAFAAGFALLWFVIALILLMRPPGIPEFLSEETGSDEQYVIRKDVIPTFPWMMRVRLALSVACGSCLLIWLTLGLLA